MAYEWQTKTLAEVIEIIGGGTPKTNVKDYWNGVIPWLSVVDFNTGLRWVSKTEKSITELGLKKSSTVMLNSRDIIISARGTVGAIAQLTKPMAFNQSCYGIRGVGSITNTDYIYYVLKHAVTGLKKIAHGAVFDTITRDTFQAIEVFIPPLDEQKRIAAVLGALDDKIELNRKMNASLEELVRTLFQSWFVNFDPVLAKLDGHKPLDLEPTTATLFPDQLTETPLGHIPKGWTTGKLGDIGSNSRRGVHPSAIAPDTPYIALEHMPRRRIAISDWDISANVASGKSTFKKGDILFGKLRPYFHKVGIAPVDGVCSTDILVLAPLSPEWFGFLLGHASSDELIQFTDLASTGTKMPRTNWSDISSFKVALPPKPIAAAFTRNIQPMLERIQANILHTRTLAALRDALLPKLLSGELKVEELVS